MKYHVSTPVQVKDMIVVRLFTRPHSPITQRVSEIAHPWLVDRAIIATSLGIAKHKLISLPDEYKQYQNWANAEFTSGTASDLFEKTLDDLYYSGWNTARRFMIEFTVKERAWLILNAFDATRWML